CPMAPRTTYEVTLSGAEDFAGNKMKPMTWSFTTDDAITNTSMFSASAKPQTASVDDRSPVEVGVKFQATETGVVTGMRLYQGDQNTGVHVVHIWDEFGNLK